MKIGIVTPDDHSIIVLCKGMINWLIRDNNCKVITISPVTNYLSNIERLGVLHVPIRMNRYISPVDDLAYLISLYKIFVEYELDVVVNYSTKPVIYGSIAAKLAKSVKVVSAIRGLGRVFQSDLNLNERLLKFLVMFLYRVSFRLSGKVWFNNQSDLNYFLSKGMVKHSQVILTRNAININYFSPLSIDENGLRSIRNELGLKDDNIVVIMVARLLWPKGVKEFVEASKIVEVRNPFVRFILVGPLEEGSPKSIPKLYLTSNARSSNFKWLGFRNDVRELYAISDIAVLPSYYKEGGYPRALLEPMGMGKPVITTNLPDCKGPVEEGKNGYLVPPRDSEALAAAIENLVQDVSKREEFGHYSRIKAEKEFDEEKVNAVVIQELYNLV